MDATGSSPARFADALRAPSFAAVFAAETQSVVGDQLARVAVAVLVFRETGSATATGLSIAATFLPAIVGGAALGPIGDRFPRRHVMIGVDVLRAVLFGLMALPGVPTAARMALLVLAVLIGPLFSSAAVSYLAGALSPEVFRAGTGLRMLNNQAAQVVGFAAGGALAGALGPRAVLALDAVTFVLSAAIVASAAPRERGRASADPSAAGLRVRVLRTNLWDDRRIRGLIGLSALAGFFVAPEGLAIPIAERWDGSAARAGLLLAAIPLGSVVGVYLVVRRLPPVRRVQGTAVMAVLCGVPLVLSAWATSFPFVFACWFVSGAFAAYQVEVISQVVHSIPDAVRVRTVGAWNAVLIGVQGIGVALFGVVADYATPARSVGIAGGLGAVGAALVAGTLLRRSAPASA